MPPAMSLLLTVVLLAIAQVVAEPPDPPEHLRIVSIKGEKWTSWSHSNPDQEGLIFLHTNDKNEIKNIDFEKRNGRLYSRKIKKPAYLRACIEGQLMVTQEECSDPVKFPEETEEITTCETAEDPPYEQNASRDPEFEEWPAKPKDVQYKTVNKRTWIRWDHPEKSTGKVTFHYCSGSEMYPYYLPNIISERYGNCPPMYTYTGTPKKLYVFACEERDGLKCCSPYIEATETPDAESSLAPPRQDESRENNPENETPDAESSLAPPGQDQSQEYNPENETPDAESSMAPSGQDQSQRPPAPQNVRLVVIETLIYLSWDNSDLPQKVTYYGAGRKKHKYTWEQRADGRLYALIGRKKETISIKACFGRMRCSDEVQVQEKEYIKTCKDADSQKLYEQNASRDPQFEAWPAAPKDVHYFKQTIGEDENILIIWDHTAKSTGKVEFEYLKEGFRGKAHYWFWKDLPDCPLMYPLKAKQLTSFKMRAVEKRGKVTCYSEYVEATEYNEKSGTLAAGSSLTSSGHEPSQGQKRTSDDSQPTQRKRQRVSYSQEGSSTSRRRVGGPQGEGPSNFQRRDDGPQEKSRSDSKGKGREYNPESETLAEGSSLTSSGHEPSQGKKRAHEDDLDSRKRQKAPSDSQGGGRSSIYRLLNSQEPSTSSDRQGEGGGPQEKPSTSSDRQGGGGPQGRIRPSLANILN